MKLGNVQLRPSGLLSQGQVEAEILRLSDRLEESTDLLGQQLQTVAEAEVAYKQAEAIALLRSTQKNESQRKAEALTINAEKHRDYRISDARATATSELCRTLRASLSALQTLSSNLRSQV